ncbi:MULTISPECIES: CPBP family intramembrane glutamic endopeptidase [Haloferax]|uniref:CPBP family intramembrane metalloprotease n=2 Tax=Haloferax TaxID=2251 RepID=A0A6G1Z5P4_9EURY|nr:MULTISPECIES: CPBP family intramembrane glutamic endopeptidase [Haloferax]KAB1189140.1 CPBP family intramembrane metalloprotease [Haloferax sp. CBA1149]MRW81876.1 CPBP family intramembrane metalloprotease [Haloferax marinisediminis]
MTDWAAFTGFTGLVLVVLLSFAYVSRGVPHGDGHAPSFDDASRRETSLSESDDVANGGDEAADSSGEDDRTAVADTDVTSETDTSDDAAVTTDEAAVTTDTAATGDDESVFDRVSSAPVVPTPDPASAPADLPTYLLIANVAVSQGVLGAFLAVGAWYTGIPAAALGLSTGDLPTKVGIGIALGLALYGANRLGSTLSRQFGFTPDEALRESLTPESRAGWVLLLFVALPLIAGFEELLFRGALVGAVAVGFDVSPWLMAAVSSAAFGAGHSAQGRLGIIVTGLLGFVLAAAFVLTESLLVVVVAHYLVNALEFVGNALFDW